MLNLAQLSFGQMMENDVFIDQSHVLLNRVIVIISLIIINSSNISITVIIIVSLFILREKAEHFQMYEQF